MTVLHSTSPVRAIRTSKSNLTGRVSVGDDSASFESSLERDWLLILDFLPEVLSLREQPFTIKYEWNGKVRRYTPDVVAEYSSAGGKINVVVYEVKRREYLRKKWKILKPRFKAAVKFCKARGWKFKIVTEKEIRSVMLKNACFLRRYRTTVLQPLVREHLLTTMSVLGPTTPQALLEAAYWTDESKMGALAELWKLVCESVIRVDLMKPLTMSTRIWIEPQ
ncbi:MAG: TnsA endonuclease N-terminal domain-containing protein [Arenimonas sp.]